MGQMKRTAHAASVSTAAAHQPRVPSNLRFVDDSILILKDSEKTVEDRRLLASIVERKMESRPFLSTCFAVHSLSLIDQIKSGAGLCLALQFNNSTDQHCQLTGSMAGCSVRATFDTC